MIPMGNKGGEDVPSFHRGQPLLAADLNKIVALVTRKIFGAEPIKVTSVAGGIVISSAPPNTGRRTVSPDFIARLTVNVGSGAYTFVEVDPTDNSALDGGRTDNAKDLNRGVVLNADPVTGQVVRVFTIGGNFYIDSPMEDC